ncbi:hypothetical protein ABG768_000565, partial [Culter alburnus]
AAGGPSKKVRRAPSNQEAMSALSSIDVSPTPAVHASPATAVSNPPSLFLAQGAWLLR